MLQNLVLATLVSRLDSGTSSRQDGKCFGNPDGGFVGSTVTVAVPATTANLGPGFDCLGAALTLHNQFTFTLLPDSSNPLVMTVQGVGADRVTTTPDNLAYQAFAHVFQALNQPLPAVQIDIQLGIPMARGLGSSATAIVGGLVGANALAGSPLNQAAIVELAVNMEGHPDNVVPAFLGGCRLSASGLEQNWQICDLTWHNSIIPVVAIPAFELSTKEARRVLPDHYSRADAVFNTAHLGLLLQGLATGKEDWLRAALQDRIHQPYRKSLIPGYEAVEMAALEAGAYGLVISGAGPTLLALTNDQTAALVHTSMASAWTQAGIEAEVKVLQVSEQGAVVTHL